MKQLIKNKNYRILFFIRVGVNLKFKITLTVIGYDKIKISYNYN